MAMGNTNVLYFFPVFLVSSAKMSSLEEPLGLDKLPSLSTIDIQRFSSTACRPRAEDMGMGSCWIEGRNCGSSNDCK